MDILTRAAYSWSRKSEKPIDDAHYFVDEELLTLYDHRLANSKSSSPQHLKPCFAQLVHELGVSTTVSRVIDIHGSTVYFRPLLLDPGHHLSAQAACFAALVNYWKNTAAPIDLLVVDLSDATMQRVQECMQDVTVSDVTRGIHIWETLPCRIAQIIIQQPMRMPKLNWTMRQFMWMCVPKKVLSKIRLTQQPYGEFSPKRDTDANGDVFRCALDDSVDANAFGAQESIE